MLINISYLNLLLYNIIHLKKVNNLNRYVDHYRVIILLDIFSQLCTTCIMLSLTHSHQCFIVFAKNGYCAEINHFKYFITLTLFPPNSPTYKILFSSIHIPVGPLMLSYTKYRRKWPLSSRT